MPDLPVRDRVTAILTLAEAAELHGVGEGDLEAWAAFYANCRSETPWLARRLLEALDTIDKARELHYDDNGDCHECDLPAPCLTVRLLALNGGNE